MSLHPRHGTHDPTTGTPRQRSGSIRRTTMIDLLRPEGPNGEVIVDGRGRDRRLARDGTARVADDARLRARLDFAGGRALREIQTEPDINGVQALIGAGTASGFRAKVTAAEAAEAAEADNRTLPHLLLDDLPGAVLVSGYALHSDSEGHGRRADPAQQEAFLAGRADLCAGFATTATMLVELVDTGILPLPTGPVAPRLDSPDDPAAWHSTAALPQAASADAAGWT
jgi:hypothetical protein